MDMEGVETGQGSDGVVVVITSPQFPKWRVTVESLGGTERVLVGGTGVDGEPFFGGNLLWCQDWGKAFELVRDELDAMILDSALGKALGDE